MKSNGIEKRGTRTRAVLAVLLALAVVLAGCTGVIDGAEDRAKGAVNDAINDTMNDSTSGALNASGVPDAASVPANATMLGFGFDRPARYTYDVAVGQGDLPSTGDQPVRGRLTVDVREVKEGNVTLSTRYELDGETYEGTLSGTQEEVATEFATNGSTNASPKMSALQSHATLALTLGMSLYLAGYVTPLAEAQSLASEGESVSYDATGTDTYAGVECSVTELTINGTPTVESCVSTDLGLPVAVVLYDDTGTPDTWVTLVEYES